MYQWLKQLWQGPSDDGGMAMWDRMARRNELSCEICSGRAVYLCPMCHVPIANHTHENDYSCKVHGFVNPVREADGVTMNGDGLCHDVEPVRHA